MEKIKIFFFPYAGGSARVYNSWKQYFPDDFEIIPVEMKGRGARFGEKQCASVEEMVEDALQQIRHQIEEGVYAFFGHSMGAIVAHELTFRILEEDLPGPIHLFLSGREAPHVSKERSEEEKTYLLPDDRFKEKLHDMGGTPKEILENPELMDIFTPILRQDFKSCDLYQHKERDFQLNCGITVLTGMEEDLIEEQINGWQKYTNKKIDTKRFPGDHFFIFDHTLHILRIVCRTLYEIQKSELNRSTA